MTGPHAMTPQPHGRLLVELHALRALARRLLRDAHAADDAVQEAALAAITRPLPDEHALRGWLSAILRNVIRQRVRAERRRARRERGLAATPLAPSAADVAAELAEHRRLLRLVHELDEPLRQIVFLRYWRGLAPAEIARLLGVTPKTVQVRLRRGLQRLREQLDGGAGGRSGWVLALGALLHGRATTLPVTETTTVLALLMKTKLVVAAVVFAAVALLLPLVLHGEGAPPSRAASSSSLAAAPPAPAPSTSAPAARAELPVNAPAPVAVAAPVATVAGTVQDLRGAPVGGVAVVFRRLHGDRSLAVDPSVAPVVSGDDGAFSLPLPAGEGCLDVQGASWASVLRPWLEGRVPADAPVLVVAPRRRYAGTVVGPDGAPVAGARVVVEVDGRIVPTRAVRASVLALPSDLATTETDVRGQFAFDDVGALDGARLHAECEPLQAATIALPPDDRLDLLLQLGAPDAARACVYGVVVDAHGAALPGALVAAGGASVSSGPDGRFAAPWGYGQRPAAVRAVHPDRGAVEMRLDPGPAQPGWRPDQPITLVLPDAAGVCRGRVVDAEGQPVAGARVWTPDLTYFGTIEREEQGHEISREVTVEGMANRPDPWTLVTTSGADGAFALHGLLPRRYALFVLDPSTLAATGPIDVSPGEDVELVVPSVDLHRVAGQLVAADGTPLAGVRVSLGRTLPWQPSARDLDPWAGSPVRRPGAAQRVDDRSVVSDTDGRFAFEGIAIEGVYLAFEGEPVFLPEPVALSPQDDLDALRLVLPARSSFHVALRDPTEASRFRLERDGRHAPVFVRVEGFEMSMGAIDLVDGRSPVCSTAAGPATLILLRDDDEVRRVEITLPAGRGQVIEP